MAKKTAYQMHEDYKKLPSFDFRFNKLLVGAVNGLMALDRYRTGRSADPRISRRKEQIQNPDGSAFNVIIMSSDNQQDNSPALIYYHGGAFALSYASLHLQSCERYALGANCCVIFVDYRLGPSKPFPSGFDDCYRTLEWVRENAQKLRINVAKIAVMGDSAGGALSAGVAQKAKDNRIPLCAQTLIYPVLDNDCKTESATQFSDTPTWNAGSNRNMWKMYLRDCDSKNPPPYAAPAHREDLTELARAYVETAEFDPLRDEGLEYANRLEEQGVKVQRNATAGTIHGYELSQKNPETVRSMKERVAFLNEVFST